MVTPPIPVAVAVSAAVSAATLFADHRRSFANNRYVYPVISRRSRGLSVGINLNPDKICNFDCVYCCVDRRTAGDLRPIDMSILEVELAAMLELVANGGLWECPPFDKTPPELRSLHDIALSGDGEPTSAKEFPEVLRLVARLRAQAGLDTAHTVIITNATLLQRPSVAAAIDELRPHDEVWGKLDAGSEDYYQLIDRTRVPLATVLANLAATGRRRPLTIQSLFMTLHGIPPSEVELDTWASRIAHLQQQGAAPRLVQVYTTARTTAEAHVGPLSRPALLAIAHRIHALGLPAQVFSPAG